MILVWGIRSISLYLDPQGLRRHRLTGHGVPSKGSGVWGVLCASIQLPFEGFKADEGTEYMLNMHVCVCICMLYNGEREIERERERERPTYVYRCIGLNLYT